MAKGDSKRIQQQQQQTTQDIDTQRQRVGQALPQFQNAFTNALNQQTGDYTNVMGRFGDISNRYNDIYNRPDFTMSPQYKGNIDQAIGGYQNFANTGGFSPQDIQDIRARGIAPTRGIYQRGVDELNRQRNLTGGSNIPAAIARQSRQANQAISEANINTNAGIAQMVQQGKLAGLGGVGQLAGQQLGLQNTIDQQNLARLFGATAGQQGAAEGMRGLYGTSPGMAGQFGNQVLGALGLSGEIPGMGMQNAQNMSQIQQQHQPWWKQALGIAGTVAPFALAPFTGGASLFGAGGTGLKGLPGGTRGPF